MHLLERDIFFYLYPDLKVIFLSLLIVEILQPLHMILLLLQIITLIRY